MTFPFGLRVILILILLSGAIAWIGDYLGKFIGKRRLTLWGLRPRSTATGLTILSGILIALVTLGVLLSVSQDARTALFGLEKLHQSLSELKESVAQTKVELKRKVKELKAAKREITGLEHLKEKLKREVETARQGMVLFRVGEVISTSLIRGGPKENLAPLLKQMLSATDTMLRRQGIQSQNRLIFLPADEFENTLSYLEKNPGEFIIQLVATRNVLWNEEIPAHFVLFPNHLIYKSQQLIAFEDIEEGLSVAEIEQKLKELLWKSHLAAKKAGVLPDPSGSIGSIPYSEIFNLARKIQPQKRKVQVSVVAAKDIYRIGPLEVQFKLSYK